MKNYILFCISFLAFSGWALGQSKPIDMAVELSATYITSPKFAIKIQWVPDSNCNGYYLYRKTRDKDAWGAYLKSLKKNEYIFIDTGVEEGKRYEYFVRRNYASLYGAGYIEAGYNIPQTDFRGGLIFAIESGLKDSLTSEIDLMISDFIGDGWKVFPVYVDKRLKPAQVKELFKDIHTAHPGIQQVYIFGRVPVPYSGNIVPDAHRPDHEGAWPADGYYGDIDFDWEDAGVNTSKASRTANHNIPGDGKFDENIFPTDVEFAVGRTDMNGMNIFGTNEYGLLRNYVQKNHAYRHKHFNPVYRAIIDDNFGYMSGESFAGNAYRNFSALLGPGHYRSADYFGTLKDSTLIWSYGCGGGSYTSAGGIGNSQMFADSNIQGVFTNLFGSYFGDWDINNNFLRAPLASPKSKVLINAWVGRPWWVFHHMGNGEPVGYAAKATINGTNLYGNQYNFAAGYVSVCLMGDPTLRMFMIEPASNISLSKYDQDTRVNIQWKVSGDAVDGYHVYRADSLMGDFVRITGNPVNGNTFQDPWPKKGNNIYMVRAYRKEITNAAVFGNLSQGVFASIFMDSVRFNSVQNPQIPAEVYPNPAQHQLVLSWPGHSTSQVSLIDLNGRVCWHTQLIGKEVINISQLPRGLYIIRFADGGEVWNKKIVLE